MAYIVNAEIPKHCNKCPFGMCKFSKPLSDRTHGYTCNLEVPKKGHNKTTMITDYDSDIEKPDWCPLRPVPEKKEVCGKYPQPDKIPASYKIGYNQCIDDILGGTE